MRKLLKVSGADESRSSKRATDEQRASLSILESIVEEKTRTTEDEETRQQEEEKEWQCHQCTTVNGVNDTRCTTCWANKRKIPKRKKATANSK